VRGALTTSTDRLWAYLILPVIALLLVSTLAYGTYFALLAMRPEVATPFPAGQVTFGLYLLMAIIEWSLAISIIRRLRRAGGSAMQLIAPNRHPWSFRWLPAVLVFVAVNLVMALMMFALSSLERATTAPSYYEGLQTWQLLLFLVVVPFSAGFCEELVWRGYVISRLEARGPWPWAMDNHLLLRHLFRFDPLTAALALHLHLRGPDGVPLHTGAKSSPFDDQSCCGRLLEFRMVLVPEIGRCAPCECPV
jgi:membrane protease YdiL (CAAX protease family)